MEPNSDMQPDFKALAYAWLNGDPRSADLQERDPERYERLAAKLAEALARRRSSVEPPIDDKDSLIVTVPEERFTATGLDTGALDQLQLYVQEHIDKFPEN